MAPTETVPYHLRQTADLLDQLTIPAGVKVTTRATAVVTTLHFLCTGDQAPALINDLLVIAGPDAPDPVTLGTGQVRMWVGGIEVFVTPPEMCVVCGQTRNPELAAAREAAHASIGASESGGDA